MMLGLFATRIASKNYVDDFTGFIIGAKLLGSEKIYDVPTNLALQQQIVGLTDPGIIFVRPPFWALAIKPFLRLPYRSALLVWRWLMVAALVAFAAVSRDQRVMLALCASIPAAGAIAAANDLPLILLLIGISLALHSKGWRFASGAALGMCLAKFHFLVFLPLLLLRREYRRELQGFLSVTAVLIAINFVVQPNWPTLYWHGLTIPQANMNSRVAMMPNVYTVFSWTRHPSVAVVLGGMLIAALLWRACGRVPFKAAMPLCILGATVAAPHTTYLDCALAIPAVFALAPGMGWQRMAAWFLLSPVAGLLAYLGPPLIGPAVVVAASLWVVGHAAGLGSMISRPGASQTCPKLPQRV